MQKVSGRPKAYNIVGDPFHHYHSADQLTGRFAFAGISPKSYLSGAQVESNHILQEIPAKAPAEVLARFLGTGR